MTYLRAYPRDHYDLVPKVPTRLFNSEQIFQSQIKESARQKATKTPIFREASPCQFSGTYPLVHLS
jgi:hypothetical protein